MSDNLVNLVGELLQAGFYSVAELRDRIGDVRYGDVETNSIRFTLDGNPHNAQLKGRNRQLILTNDRDKDTAIVVRAILDGDSDV